MVIYMWNKIINILIIIFAAIITIILAIPIIACLILILPFCLLLELLADMVSE